MKTLTFVSIAAQCHCLLIKQNNIKQINMKEVVVPLSENNNKFQNIIYVFFFFKNNHK